MDTNDPLASICRALEALDGPELVAHYWYDAEFEDAVDGTVVKGRTALLAMYDRLFSLPNTAFMVNEAFSCGDRVALAWTWAADNPGSGERRAVRGASILELREGKIQRETIYYDSKRAPV